MLSVRGLWSVSSPPNRARRRAGRRSASCSSVSVAPGLAAIHKADGEASPTGRLRALYPLVHFELASNLVYFLNSHRGKRGIEYLSYGSGDTLDLPDFRLDLFERRADLLGDQVRPQYLLQVRREHRAG